LIDEKPVAYLGCARFVGVPRNRFSTEGVDRVGKDVRLSIREMMVGWCVWFAGEFGI